MSAFTVPPARVAEGVAVNPRFENSAGSRRVTVTAWWPSSYSLGLLPSATRTVQSTLASLTTAPATTSPRRPLATAYLSDTGEATSHRCASPHELAVTLR